MADETEKKAFVLRKQDNKPAEVQQGAAGAQPKKKYVIKRKPSSTSDEKKNVHVVAKKAPEQSAAEEKPALDARAPKPSVEQKVSEPSSALAGTTVVQPQNQQKEAPVPQKPQGGTRHLIPQAVRRQLLN